MIIMVCWLVELVLPRVDTQTLINKTQHEIIYTNADMNMHECIMMSSVHYILECFAGFQFFFLIAAIQLFFRFSGIIGIL